MQAVGDIAHPGGFAGDDLGAHLFDPIRRLLTEGDLNLANLESPYTLVLPLAAGRPFALVTPPARLGWLVEAGFNLFSVANNHIGDAGVPGIRDTLATIASLQTPERPLWVAGARLDATGTRDRQPLVIALHGGATRIAFFAFAQGAQGPWIDNVFADDAPARIAEAAKSVDAVIVSAHAGHEYKPVASAIVARYRAFVDAGARIVFGHHPHVAQAVERRAGGVIYYSLGNGSFASRTERQRDAGVHMLGLLARVALGCGEIVEAYAYPLHTDPLDPFVVGGEEAAPHLAVPDLLHGALARAALGEIVQQSRALPGAATGAIAIDGDRLVLGAVGVEGAPPRDAGIAGATTPGTMPRHATP